MNSKKLSIGLFSFYCAALTWIILFNFSFSLEELPHLRNISLIPFAESVIVNGKVDFSEIFQNLFAFIPFGVLISTISENKSFLQKLLPAFFVSLTFEVLQFIFSIGASDITDVITNTLGGLIGIGIFMVLRKLFKRKYKTVINIVSLIFAILFSGLMLMLFLAN